MNSQVGKTDHQSFNVSLKQLRTHQLTANTNCIYSLVGRILFSLLCTRLLGVCDIQRSVKTVLLFWVLWVTHSSIIHGSYMLLRIKVDWGCSVQFSSLTSSHGLALLKGDFWALVEGVHVLILISPEGKELLVAAEVDIKIENVICRMDETMCSTLHLIGHLGAEELWNKLHFLLV